MKPKRKGRLTDLTTGESRPLNWAGHWSVMGGRENIGGASIPLRYLPKMNLDIRKVYRIQFETATKGQGPHHVDIIGALVGIEGIEDPVDRRKCARFVKFQALDNFEVLKRLKEFK